MDSNPLFKKFVAFSAAVHQITNDMTKDVKPEALTPVQYKILEYIAVSQPVTLSEISDCMNMSMPNTSRELRKLTEQGLLIKETDAEDRRRQGISLSPAGQAMVDEVFRRVAQRVSGRIAHLTEEQRQEIEHALDLLQERIFYV
ncbi:MarR family winged helix-turn-helix transcriptional regulator [Paenibacillus tengchongensis]|uniref:MarR family winged helix-turn-helix transcriptional regulator n=1 Tax=Paenibacillus tengchongensis TaxID=2608684 RepID=UPI00124BE165|nr:MarR family transcriptional regulator [Paenibacillus tengchongensis]